MAKSIEMADRNARIIQMSNEGRTLAEIGAHFGLSRARISQIINEYDSEIGDDDYRAVMRVKLESFLNDTLEPLRHGPGKPLVANGNGQWIKDEFGNPVYDEFVKIDVINTEIRVIERLTKLYAIDKVRIKETADQSEMDRVVAFFEETLREKKELEERLAAYEGPPQIMIADVIDDASGED